VPTSHVKTVPVPYESQALGLHTTWGNSDDENRNQLMRSTAFHESTVPCVRHELTSTDDNSHGFQTHKSARRRRHRIRRENRHAMQAPAADYGDSNQNSNWTRKYPESASAAHSTRKLSHQPLMIGMRAPRPTGNSVLQIAAARTLKSVYCVDNVNKSFDESALMKFVSGLARCPCSDMLQSWQREHGIKPDCKAFRICINCADNAKFLNETKWPADITILRWFSIRTNNANDPATGSDSAAVATDIEHVNSDDIL